MAARSSLVGKDAAEEIVIFLPNRPFFGASLVLIPALLQVRRSYPGCRLVALANHGMGKLYVNWGLADETFNYSKAGAPWATFRRSLSWNPQIIVNCRPRSIGTHVWTLLLRSRVRRCFRHGLGRFIQRNSRPWNSACYKAYTYLDLVGAEGSGERDGAGVEAERSGDLLANWAFIDRPVDEQGHLILIPSGGSPDKKWPLTAYAEIARCWRDRFNTPVRVLVGPGDPEILAWLETPIARELGLRRVEGGLAAEAAALRGAAAVVGNDCGPNHVAQLLDRPRVVIFPPWGDPKEWFRPGRQAAFIVPPGPLAELPVAAVWTKLLQVMDAVE